ncbi:hypothetical protein ETD83_02465 [Actinomadura soli]|uniref:DUF4429 domain-containing protein n=1 Tax=Actinomadura soli TaxID=2508997 RepID=A0A5C4JIT0_9ACTN|nr:DUF4429 domain-containing protein [Actinomadura soli]TMR06904.1 hypothetical protein ETD83_02465 [Actinomadura soli]
MVGSEKCDPRTIKAHQATVTLHADRVEISRRGLGRVASDKHTVIPLAEIVQVQWKDPTVLVNGCLFLATAEDVKTVKPLGASKEKAIGGNPHVVLFTSFQRKRYAELRAAVKAAVPDVPTAPVG